MNMRDMIGQEVNISHVNTDFVTKGILLDIDSGGLLIEVLYTNKPSHAGMFPYEVGDIAYIRNVGFHLNKTKALIRDSKLNELFVVNE